MLSKTNFEDKFFENFFTNSELPILKSKNDPRDIFSFLYDMAEITRLGINRGF
jgi:hypothetical protein